MQEIMLVGGVVMNFNCMNIILENGYCRNNFLFAKPQGEPFFRRQMSFSMKTNLFKSKFLPYTIFEW